MSYKFVKVTSFYNQFMRSLYMSNPDLKNYSYKEQYNFIMSQKFGWADYYTKELEKLGVQVFDEIICNGLSIQQKWSEENHCPFSGSDLIIEQLRNIQPDVVFLQDVYNFNGEFVYRLREDISSIKLVIGWLCAPYPNELLMKLRPFDIILTCVPNIRDDLLSNHFESYLVNHGFDHSILDSLQENQYHDEDEIDLCFAGSFF